MTISLSAALEDYLEIILELNEKEGVARVTDIADKLNVAKSTVSQTINKLKTLGLIIQDSYGPIMLTKTGKEQASKVRNRHRVLRAFLIEVLGVDNQTAEKDACLIEHVVSPITMIKLSEYLKNNANQPYLQKVSEKDEISNEGGEEEMGTNNTRALNELGIGEKGKVIRITAKGTTRRRILDMGVTPGTEISIKGMAPLGDPIEILVKGYRLSLRKEEAADVFVEVF